MEQPKKKARVCPQCGAPVESLPANLAFPFCTMRCKRVDLGRWLGEEFTVPVESPDWGEGGGGSGD